MNLGTRLNRVLTRLLLLQEAGAVDYSRDRVSQGSGGHGAHGDPSRPPSGTSRPLVQQWAERFEHLIEAAERDAGMSPAEVAPRFTGQRLANDLRARIHEYEGHDPVFVAFVERCSVELVRKIRKERGLHMVTGARLESRERPLTAPARESLRVLQDVGGEG